jgi:hypothetical protein
VVSFFFKRLRDAFRPGHVNNPAAYREFNQIIYPVSYTSMHQKHITIPVPILQKAVVCCPAHKQIHYSAWSLIKLFIDQQVIFYSYICMGYSQRTDWKPKFQHSLNSSLFETTPKEGRTGWQVTDTNTKVIIQKIWKLSHQCQAFAMVVWAAHSWGPPTWLLNMWPGGKDHQVNDLFEPIQLVRRRVQYG